MSLLKAHQEVSFTRVKNILGAQYHTDLFCMSDFNVQMGFEKMICKSFVSETKQRTSIYDFFEVCLNVEIQVVKITFCSIILSRFHSTLLKSMSR